MDRRILYFCLCKSGVRYYSKHIFLQYITVIIQLFRFYFHVHIHALCMTTINNSQGMDSHVCINIFVFTSTYPST
jgi:hypothetical protein